MTKENFLSLNEKFRILSHLFVDIIERNNLKQTSRINLSENQFLILKILFASGPKKNIEIAEILNVSNPAASKNIDYLVQKSLVRRKQCINDRRTMEISLLKKGKDIVSNYDKISEAKVISILKHFNDKENKTLNLLLDKYIHFCLNQEDNLSLFCLQCGGKYEGKCPISEHRTGCYFQLDESTKNNTIHSE